MFALWTVEEQTLVDNIVDFACCQVPTREGRSLQSIWLPLAVSVQVINLRKFSINISVKANHQDHSCNGDRKSSQLPPGAQNLRAVFSSTQGEFNWWRTWEQMQHLLSFLTLPTTSKKPEISFRFNLTFSFSQIPADSLKKTQTGGWLVGFFNLMTSLAKNYSTILQLSILCVYR